MSGRRGPTPTAPPPGSPTRGAVERTVPFEFLVQTLVTYWYATAGHHRDDLAGRLAAEPWYIGKTEPAFEDMLAKLRRTQIAAHDLPPLPQTHSTPT